MSRAIYAMAALAALGSYGRLAPVHGFDVGCKKPRTMTEGDRQRLQAAKDKRDRKNARRARLNANDAGLSEVSDPEARQ